MSVYTPSDQVIAATIIGTCTLSATVLKIWVDVRAAAAAAKTQKQAAVPRPRPRRKSSRPLVFASVVASIVSMLMLTAFRIGMFAEVPETAGNVVQATARMGAGLLPGRTPTVGSAAQPIAAAETMDSWIRTRGLVIYYRAGALLPGACPGRPMAYGNWESSDTRIGMPARCIDEEWLAFDLEPLVGSARVVRNLTYCIDFNDGHAGWGRHASAGAPGFSAIELPSTHLPSGHAIGFRVTRDVTGDRVLLTTGLPRVAC